MVPHDCNYNYLGGVGRRIAVQGLPRQKYETLSEKQTKSKRVRGMTQVVELIPSKSKALGLIPIPSKTK
jgi:hypothetical protein